MPLALPGFTLQSVPPENSALLFQADALTGFVYLSPLRKTGAGLSAKIV
jgi:hypothetical protein